MDLEALGNIADAVAALGVIASLLYLIKEVRRNTRAVRATAFQNTADTSIQQFMFFASNPAAAVVWQTGLARPEALDPEQTAQFQYMALTTLRVLENLYVQYTQRTVDEMTWNARDRLLREVLAESAGFRSVWSRQRSFFREDFVAYLDWILEQKEGAPAAAPEASPALGRSVPEPEVEPG